ncbi:MAG: hypothetical protein ACR2IT_10025, partial [Pirellulales bacterium]
MGSPEPLSRAARGLTAGRLSRAGTQPRAWEHHRSNCAGHGGSKPACSTAKPARTTAASAS